VNHRHRKGLHALCAHPVRAYNDLKAVRAMLVELGAEAAHGGGGRVFVKRNGWTHRFHDAKYSLSKDEVLAIPPIS